jgi:hypothetical protein
MKLRFARREDRAHARHDEREIERCHARSVAFVHNPAMTKSSASPAKQIASFLAKYTPELRREANAGRAALRKLMPTAVELVYDNYNALVFAFGASERASEAIVSLALYPRYVTLFFLYGVGLADPDGLLVGAGKQVRSIRLESSRDLARPSVRALIASAIARAKAPLPASGRGASVIRAAVAKQRSRRPAR